MSCGPIARFRWWQQLDFANLQPRLLVQRMTPNRPNDQMKGGAGQFLLQAGERRVETERERRRVQSPKGLRVAWIVALLVRVPLELISFPLVDLSLGWDQFNFADFQTTRTASMGERPNAVENQVVGFWC